MRAAPDLPHPRSTAKLLRHPLHPSLVHFPIAFFIGAAATDVAYWQTMNLMWSNFSIWLISAGLAFGGLAAVAGFIDYAANPRVRRQREATPHMVLNLIVMAVALLNAFVHSRDGWTAVVPQGLILSGITVVLLGVSAWLGSSLVYLRGVGVQPADEVRS